MASARRRVRRLITIAAASLLLVSLIGATYQGVATALERRESPHPGGMVSVGDHQLHIHCTGHGTPTVLLEAPAAGFSASWAAVQRQLTTLTRVCSYDRSGLGWSEAGDAPFDPGRVAEELRTLLTAAKEPGPFIVAAQGLGATFAQMYAARGDSETEALVLIDVPASSHMPDDSDISWIMPAAPWLARFGILRASEMLSTRARDLPGASGSAVRAFLNRPDHLTRAAAELRKWDDAVALAAAMRVGPQVRTTELQTDDAGRRVAFLTNPSSVEQVARALEHQVQTSRKASKIAR